MLPVVKGIIGLGTAICYFSKLGNIVSLPLVDNQAYDLIVDKNGALQKVQVKYTSVTSKKGFPEVQLKSIRSNHTVNKIIKFDSSKVDIVVIVTANGHIYEIPSKEIKVSSQLTLDARFDKYKYGGIF